MTIEVLQTVKEIDITIEQNGNTVTITPVICKTCEGFDGVIDGGTP